MPKRKKKTRKFKKVKKTKKINLSQKQNSNETIFKLKKEWIKQATVDKKTYEKKYKQSIKDNDGFWKKEGKRITWIKPYTKIKNVKYSKSEVNIKWYYDGTLNASANCIDRHLKNKKDKTAIIWVGDDPKVSKKISYKELLAGGPRGPEKAENSGKVQKMHFSCHLIGTSIHSEKHCRFY